MKNWYKTLKNEIKEIKWISSRDAARQTLFCFSIITIAMSIFMGYDLVIQKLLSMIIK